MYLCYCVFLSRSTLDLRSDDDDKKKDKTATVTKLVTVLPHLAFFLEFGETGVKSGFE